MRRALTALGAVLCLLSPAAAQDEPSIGGRPIAEWRPMIGGEDVPLMRRALNSLAECGGLELRPLYDMLAACASHPDREVRMLALRTLRGALEAARRERTDIVRDAPIDDLGAARTRARIRGERQEDAAVVRTFLDRPRPRADAEEKMHVRLALLALGDAAEDHLRDAVERLTRSAKDAAPDRANAADRLDAEEAQIALALIGLGPEAGTATDPLKRAAREAAAPILRKTAIEILSFTAPEDAEVVRLVLSAAAEGVFDAAGRERMLGRLRPSGAEKAPVEAQVPKSASPASAPAVDPFMPKSPCALRFIFDPSVSVERAMIDGRRAEARVTSIDGAAILAVRPSEARSEALGATFVIRRRADGGFEIAAEFGHLRDGAAAGPQPKTTGGTVTLAAGNPANAAQWRARFDVTLLMDPGDPHSERRVRGAFVIPAPFATR